MFYWEYLKLICETISWCPSRFHPRDEFHLLKIGQLYYTLWSIALTPILILITTCPKAVNRTLTGENSLNWQSVRINLWGTGMACQILSSVSQNPIWLFWWMLSAIVLSFFTGMKSATGRMKSTSKIVYLFLPLNGWSGRRVLISNNL